jgi:prephenate dehydrogenase
MLLDILITNRAEVLNVLERARLSWQETIELIKREDWPALRAKLEAVREKRLWWENTKRVTRNE